MAAAAKSKAAWQRWKPRLVNAAALGGAVGVVHFVFEWTWTTIFWIAVAYIFGKDEVRRIVAGELAKRRVVAEETLDARAPERPASHLLPRVWSFHLRWAVDFARATVEGRGFPPPSREFFDGKRLLVTAKIEEYPRRVRIHRWHVVGGKSDRTIYDWTDEWISRPAKGEVDHRRTRLRDGTIWRLEYHNVFASETLGACDWRLSIRWKRPAVATDDPIAYLTLWVDWHRDELEPDTVLPEDVIFDVPLNAEALDQAVESWPGPGKLQSGWGAWWCELGEGGGWQWTWELRASG